MVSIYARFLVIVLALRVNAISIKGPVLTRYNPCGIGVIYFDKITDKLWKGVINFGLYQTIDNPEIEVSFKQKMFIYIAFINSSVIAKNNWHKYTIKPKGEMQKSYVFYLSINETNPENVPVLTKFKLNNVTFCDEYVKKTQTIASLNVTKQNDTKYHHICGRRSLDNAELMSLRTESEAGDWPWHVAIMVRDPDTNELKYQCGGNIISQTAVLTAAQCLFLHDKEIPADRIIIEAGVTDLKNLNHPGRQTFVPEKTILHPAYIRGYATSDLAIIIVREFTFSEYVQPICIWGPVYDKTALYGKETVIVGFGMTEQNKLSDKLRATNIMVQDDLTCIAYAPNKYKPLLNEFTFCAGYGPDSGINPRNGDGGGGLVVPTTQTDHKVSWFLRGVLSKCGTDPPSVVCDPKFYVVYTDVGPHYSWIYHNAGLREINLVNNYFSNVAF